MIEPMAPKYRHELKYVVSSAQAAMLKGRLERLMKPDPHGGPEGRYSIRSLYFDSWDNRCFYENEDGVDPREKYRVRIYNHSPDRIMLERKRKERQMTQKTACPLALEDAQRLAAGRPAVLGQEPLPKLLAAEVRMHRARPAVIVEYDRIPFVCPVGNVRVTLDINISSSNAFQRFFDERIPRRPVMPAGQQILEVKFDELLPDFIYRGLQLDSLQRTTYSKFYICRKLRPG